MDFAEQAFDDFIQKSFIASGPDESACQIVSYLTICFLVIQKREERLKFRLALHKNSFIDSVSTSKPVYQHNRPAQRESAFATCP
jgi:hypothetical protein